MSEPSGPEQDRRWWAPWTWVPSLYFVQGLPYVVANNVSVVLYKQLKVSNAEIAFYTSWFGLIWAFKALWSPFVDGTSTKRRWVVAMQAAMAPLLAMVAFALPLPAFVQISLAMFLVLAVLSATHDIAADGFYMLGLRQDQQSAFVGVRSTFWRIALVLGEGGLVMLAGFLARQWTIEQAWTVTLLVAAGLFAVFAVFHAIVMPRPAGDPPRDAPASVLLQSAVGLFSAHTALVVVSATPPLLAWLAFATLPLPLSARWAVAALVSGGVLAATLAGVGLRAHTPRPGLVVAALLQWPAALLAAWWAYWQLVVHDTSPVLLVPLLVGPFLLLDALLLQRGGTSPIVSSFFRKEGIVPAILFLLFYRFAENHLSKLVSPFLLDAVEVGGLGLSGEAVGFAKGTVGVLALTGGGILGGLVIWRDGLRRWLWPMVFMLNAPDLVYVWLAYAQPENFPLVVALIGVEQFGYGFGFTAYMMFMIRLAEGEHKTAHYAFGTGLMALFAWAAQSWSGWAQEQLGYELFFWYVLLWILPGVWVAWLVDLPRDFGKRPGDDTVGGWPILIGGVLGLSGLAAIGFGAWGLIAPLFGVDAEIPGAGRLVLIGAASGLAGAAVLFRTMR